VKKLIIQIPCYNEEETLGVTLSALPREIPGIDVVEWLIIDDGSTDSTVEVAKEHGVDHFVNLLRNRGLAIGFMEGIKACLNAGADIIVNTDADNQYNAEDIPKLVEPILKGEAEIVVGARPISEIEHFSISKKILQKLGSWVVRVASNTDIPDAPSGFRAISRDAALRINVFNNYTYTLETIIQAGQKGILIKSVPIRVNGELRPSRLVKSIPSYIKRSIITIFRIFMTYRPFRFFLAPGITLLAFGGLLVLRFLIFWIFGQGSGHVQSLVLAGVLSGMGFQLVLVGWLADLIAVNRKMLEEVQYVLRSKNIKNNDDKNI
jgi:glycosyltransferase involved in cell wall biosynthesis